VGPAIRDVVRKFADLTGRMPLGPRWSLGYANTAMSLTDAPDAQKRLSAFIDQATKHDIPISAFHFGSGYSSIGKRRYVFTWNADKFPAPRALVQKFERAGIRLVANIKPCLLDDHPAYAEVAAQGAFVNHATTDRPCVGQFWDGVGAHVDFTHPAGIRWWQQGLSKELLDYGILGWNDNNEYEIWDDDGAAWFRQRDSHQPLAATATAVDDARPSRRKRRTAARARIHGHPGGPARHPALRADVVGRQHDVVAYVALEHPHGS
jgi:alpha-glucosidase